jgi:hypothetical protein
MKKIILLIQLLFSICFLTAQNVGIGTSTPAAKLDVKSSGNYVGQFNGAAPMYIGLFEGDIYRGYLGSYAGAPEDVDFGTGAGNINGKLHLTIQASPRLTIDASGNTGIGTTSPNHKLHIDGGDLFVQSSLGLIRFGYEGGNEWQMATTNAGADLRWYTTTDGGNTIAPRHYFSQNGNVGIGGFSGPAIPIGRLEVIGAGNSSATNNLVLRSLSGDTILRMRDDGRMGIGFNGTYGRTMNLGGTGVNFYTANEVGFGGAIFPTDTSLVIWSNSGSSNYLIMQPSWGNTGIGTYSPNAKLHLNGNMLVGNTSVRTATGYAVSVVGKIICEDLKIQLYNTWPDYVFSSDYQLMPLDQLEQSVKQNQHLPNIPSAADITAAKGIELGEINRQLLEKVEELTLYIIAINKQQKQLQQTNQLLQDRLTVLEKVKEIQ